MLRSFYIKLLSPIISKALPEIISKSVHWYKLPLNDTRSLFTSSASLLREIQIKTEDNVTVVEGIRIESDRKNKVIPNDSGKDVCPLCPERLPVPVKYTDVLVLSQFVRADGCVLPRRVTGLCQKAQRRVQRLVHQAQRAGLMPELRPDLIDGRSRTNLHSPYKWRKYNTFFDE